MTETSEWVRVVAVPALIASVPGAIGLWQWWVKRRDDRAAVAHTAGLSLAERQSAAMAAERAALTTEQRELVTRIEGERDRANKKLADEREDGEAVEQDRNRWKALAYSHYWLARDLDHEMRNARQTVEALARRVLPPEVVPEWRHIHVPPKLEDPPR